MNGTPASDGPTSAGEAGVRSMTDGTIQGSELSLEEKLLLIDEEVWGDDAGVHRRTGPPRYMLPWQEDQWVRDHYTLLPRRTPTQDTVPDLSVPPTFPPDSIVYSTHGEYVFDQMMKAGCGCLTFLSIMMILGLAVEWIL